MLSEIVETTRKPALRGLFFENTALSTASAMMELDLQGP